MAAAAIGAVAFVALCGTALAAPPPSFIKGIGDNIFVDGGPMQRSAWIQESARAEAQMVRLTINWKDVARNRPTNPSNPLDPAYREFGGLDDAVRLATANGLQPSILVNGAPAWAEGPNKKPGADGGTWNPDPAAFGEFAKAIGQRYSGSFATLEGPIPEVRNFMVWSEPNLESNLAPLWTDGGDPQPVAPATYRGLVTAFHDGLKSVNPDAEVVAGGTAPFGDDPGGPRMRPLLFLREFLCLKKSLKPSGCPDPPRFDILSHNPINPAATPRTRARNSLDASTADFHKVVKLMEAAEKGGVVDGEHPVWATELWWLTEPPTNPYGIPFRLQARYLQDGLHTLWQQGAGAVIWFQVVDQGGLTTGLFSSDGSAKPAFDAFRFPLVARRANKNRVNLWTIPPADGTVVLQRAKGKGWRNVGRAAAEEGVPQVVKLRHRGRGTFRAVIGGDTTMSDSVSG